MANDPDETTKKLQDILKDIRKLKNNRDKIESLVEELESKETLSPFHRENYQAFCEAYTIGLLRKHVHGIKNQELLLAVYGLLDGYKNIRIGERCQKYAKAADKFDKRIDPNWKDPNKSLKNIEKDITEKLIENIVLEMFDDKGQKRFLRFSKKIGEGLSRKFPNGFPAELPLPVPQYLLKETDDPENGVSDENSEGQTDINTSNGRGGAIGETTDNDDGDKKAKRKHPKKHNWMRFAVIIIAIVLTGTFAFVIFDNMFNNSPKRQSTDEGISQPQPPVRISYPDGTYIEVYGPTKIIDAEDGIILVPIDGENQSMETKSLSDETNSESISNNEEKFDPEGVDEHEEDH